MDEKRNLKLYPSETEFKRSEGDPITYSGITVVEKVSNNTSAKTEYSYAIKDGVYLREIRKYYTKGGLAPDWAYVSGSVYDINTQVKMVPGIKVICQVVSGAFSDNKTMSAATETSETGTMEYNGVTVNYTVWNISGSDTEYRYIASDGVSGYGENHSWKVLTLRNGEWVDSWSIRNIYYSYEAISIPDEIDIDGTSVSRMRTVAPGVAYCRENRQVAYSSSKPGFKFKFRSIIRHQLGLVNVVSSITLTSKTVSVEDVWSVIEPGLNRFIEYSGTPVTIKWDCYLPDGITNREPGVVVPKRSDDGTIYGTVYENVANRVPLNSSDVAYYYDPDTETFNLTDEKLDDCVIDVEWLLTT